MAESNTVRSECCNAVVTWTYDGPICQACGKWSTTKSDEQSGETAEVK